MFNNRTIVIATMHQKEQVLAPLLKEAFNITAILPKYLDTDILGTFSGEIDRKGTPMEVAKRKCLLAMEETGCDLAIASEGSFGAHPTIPFIAGDDEMVFLMDQKNGVEIFAREISTDTNFKGESISSLDDAKYFAQKIGFPSHAIIIRKEKDEGTGTQKGVGDVFLFESLVKEFLSEHGKVWLETDMRAMHNPTRLTVISKAAETLISKMQCLCPACNAPGFSVTNVLPGLPCSLCLMPTESTLAHEYVCAQCGCMEEKKYPHAKQNEEPLYCSFCNP
jgi:hypothetical protein